MPPPLLRKIPKGPSSRKERKEFLSLQTKQKRISMQKNNVKEAHQGRLEKRKFLEGKRQNPANKKKKTK